MARLSAGAASGRAATAGKALDKLNSDEVKVKKPFVPKKRTFTFPDVERMGQTAVKVQNLTHGCATHYVKSYESITNKFHLRDFSGRGAHGADRGEGPEPNAWVREALCHIR